MRKVILEEKSLFGLCFTITVHYQNSQARNSEAGADEDAIHGGILLTGLVTQELSSNTASQLSTYPTRSHLPCRKGDRGSPALRGEAPPSVLLLLCRGAE